MLLSAAAEAFRATEFFMIPPLTKVLNRLKIAQTFREVMAYRNRASLTGFQGSFRIVIFGLRCLAWIILMFQIGRASAAEVLPRGWPKLPDETASVEIPAQVWPVHPAPRHVKITIHYPFGKLSQVTAKTGLMLTLHNWGGTEAIGSADPKLLTERFDVISICVNYLQSGKQEGLDAPEPFDFGYLQALDSLRALWYVQQGLRANNILYNSGRIYVTGGSGGGQVALMCNKFAPRTFTCVIDICGMCKLTDDIAFGLTGGSNLNARWKPDPDRPYYLTQDDRDIRFVGNPKHLAEMKRLGHATKIIVVHGIEDTTSPIADAREMVQLMKEADFDVEPIFVTKNQIDGKIFTSAGHSLGQRTEIVFRVAEKYLRPDSSQFLERKSSTDFFLRDEIKYETTNGAYVISYENGFPIGRFEPKNP